jgi:hypothetical protein
MWFNRLTGGKKEHFCSRVARNSVIKGGFWSKLERGLDLVLGNRHCWEEYLSEFKKK